MKFLAEGIAAEDSLPLAAILLQDAEGSRVLHTDKPLRSR
jgi:hypothetical protein